MFLSLSSRIRMGKSFRPFRKKASSMIITTDRTDDAESPIHTESGVFQRIANSRISPTGARKSFMTQVTKACLYRWNKKKQINRKTISAAGTSVAEVI